MRILVTGATGFIGMRATNYLAEQGYDIIATGRKKIDQYGIHSNIRWQHGSLDDLDFCLALTENVDVIVHCAGKAGTWGSYESFYKANVVITENLLAAAQRSQVKRFVQMSSPSIYFDFKDQHNLKEQDLPKYFSNHYAKTKFESEQKVLLANSETFKTIALRPRFVIGAGDNNVLPRLIKLQRSSCVQIGSGKNEISVTSIGNLLDAISLAILASEEVMGEAYNIANAEPENFWDFAESLSSRFGTTHRRVKVPRYLMLTLSRINEFLARIMRRQDEPMFLPVPVAALGQSMTLDTSKAAKRLGYRATHSTEEAVNEFIAWYKEHLPSANNKQKRFSSFTEFWPFYLEHHQNPTNQALHIFGFVLALFVSIYALVKQESVYLVGIPLITYSFAWVGHIFFERNSPATWRNPFYSFRAYFKMIFYLVCRRKIP